MNDLKKIRWQQRHTNLTKAFRQLEKGVCIEAPNEIEIQGIIQSFEFTFELAWKTLKDHLNQTLPSVSSLQLKGSTRMGQISY